MFQIRIGLFGFALFLLMIPVAAASQARASEDTGQAAARTNLQSIQSFYYRDIRAAAVKLSSEQYRFRPTDDVRSAGELLAHIAQSSFSLCSLANDVGMPSGTTDLEEKAEELGKAGIVEQLEASQRYCDRQITRAALDETAGLDRKRAHKTTRGVGGAIASMVFEGKPVTRGMVATFHTTHISHHYANLVTYMRLLGVTPPSAGRVPAPHERREDTAER